MPAATPDFESLSREELITVCKALWQAVQDLTARCEHLERRVQELEAGKPPKKTSQNSSSPPSTDQKANHLAETQSEKRENSVGRSGGGRPLDPNPDAQIILRPDACGSCGVFLLDAIERTMRCTRRSNSHRSNQSSLGSRNSNAPASIALREH